MSEGLFSETLFSTSESMPHLVLVVSHVPIQEYINEQWLSTWWEIVCDSS